MRNGRRNVRPFHIHDWKPSTTTTASTCTQVHDTQAHCSHQHTKYTIHKLKLLTTYLTRSMSCLHLINMQHTLKYMAHKLKLLTSTVTRWSTLWTDFMDYLTIHRLSLLNGFTFVSVFFRFQFSKSFSSSVIFSSSLLSTLILPIIGLFFGESSWLSCFFSFFLFFINF